MSRTSAALLWIFPILLARSTVAAVILEELESEPLVISATAEDPYETDRLLTIPSEEDEDKLRRILEQHLSPVTVPSEDDLEGNSTDLGLEGETEPPPRVGYSKANISGAYLAQDKFHPRGMEHLYYLTTLFLELVNRDQEMPPELSSLVSREMAKPTFNEEQAMRVARGLEQNWDRIVLHYIGPVSLVVVGLLVAGVMPLAGLIFACCRCAGRCGAENIHYDKKGDPCRRVALGTLLTLLVVVVLFGLVCTFITNSRIEDGIEKFPSKLKVALHDTRLYLNNTRTEYDNVLVRNFAELQDVLFTKLDSSGELVKRELARVTKAIAVDNLTAIATSLPLIRADLDIIRNTTLSLQQETSTLQSGLDDVASRLRKQKEDCYSVPSCERLITQYADKLSINNVFYELPDIESKLQEVSRVIENDIESEVKRGKREFDSIAIEIQAKIQKSIPEIKEKIKKTGMELHSSSKHFRKQLKELDVKMQPAEQNIDFLEDHMYKYSDYRYWAFLGTCIILLVITMCFTCGLIFGCCGRRPDESSSCHKTTGASWLMCGVGLTFLFSTVIMLITTALFLIGTVSDVFICGPLNDPSRSEVVRVLYEQYNLDQMYPQGQAPHITDIVRRCHLNESFYSVFSIELIDDSLSRLSNYKEKLKLDEKVAQLKQKIKVETDIKILSRDAKRQLRELASSAIAVHHSWNDYTDILNQKVLELNLLKLAAVMNQTADQLPGGYENVSSSLKNDAIFLEGLQRWLNSIKRHTRTLKSTTEALSEKLKFNKTSLRVAIQDLIGQAEFAQKYLKTNGSREVITLVDRFSQDFLADVDDYVAHIEAAVGRELGRCGPVSTAYNSTTSAFCKNILLPFNGFWTSVGWCFIFFIPCMIVSVSLATLYRKTEPYSGPLTDSHESMYDAYAERDNIPLTTGYDKKQRRRSREYDAANPSVGYAAESQGVNQCSPRGNDFAPSHDWNDFPPSGGPPRYTSQPSLSPEYERPPPYYYPGPGNNA